MKVILSLLMLISSTSFAFDTRYTWEEIFSSPHLVLEHDAKLGVLHLGNACLTETEVRSIQDVKYCLKLVEVKKGENKDKWIDWVCAKYTTGTYVYPRSVGDETLPQTIPVRVTMSRGPGYPGEQFQKEYTFPNCQ